jgi:glycosyltransferase involved in cell wall biosynthesis
MRKYRILVVVRHPVGGIRTFLRYVYPRLGGPSYSFTLIAPDFSEARVLREDLKDLDVKFFLTDRDSSAWDLFRTVEKALQDEDFDLVHSHGFTSAVCSIVGALLTRTPHLLTCHDVFTPEQFSGFTGPIKRILLGTLFATVDRIHCVTNDARDNLLTYLSILKRFRHKVVVIPHGIEVGQFVGAEPRDLRHEYSLPESSFLIGFLGRFMSQKGFRYLLDALSELRKRNDLPREPLVLCFSGNDGFIREEKADVANRGLSDSVKFLPFVADVASTLKGLDVVAMPSLWEACGLLAMETMVAGVPLIGTNCTGLKEVLSNTPATVIPTRDSAALTKALLMEMKSPTTAQARDFALEAMGRFQVTERAKELETVMLELLER